MACGGNQYQVAKLIHAAVRGNIPVLYALALILNVCFVLGGISLCPGKRLARLGSRVNHRAKLAQ